MNEGTVSSQGFSSRPLRAFWTTASPELSHRLGSRDAFLFSGKTMADKATRIDLFSWRTAPMRAFHLTWMAFFVCFFAWFACAPLMPLIKREFGLSVDQVANINIAAVAATILVRLIIGPMCDRYGPRKVYTGLLLLGAFPVLGAALSGGYTSFLLGRLRIGAGGARFGITESHTCGAFCANWSPQTTPTA